jgi:tetratricopeptide (TPR) repeat protein
MFQHQKVSLLFFVLAGSLLILTASMGASDVFAAQEKAQEYLQNGVEELQKGAEADLDRALRELEKAIEEAPTVAAAYFYAGMATGQQQKFDEAWEYFITAADLSPGFGEAHKQACIVAFYRQEFSDAWDQAILAAQAGVDMDQAFAELQQQQDPPADWRTRLDAPRIMIGGLDTETLQARESGAFATRDEAGAEDMRASDAGSGSATGNPTAVNRGTVGAGAADMLTGSGLTAAVQADLSEMRRQFGQGLMESTAFAVVPRPELTNYVLTLKVDSVAENSPRVLKGFVKVFNYETSEEVYSRPLELRNISSVGDLHTDIMRYIGYLEEWLGQQ